MKKSLAALLVVTLTDDGRLLSNIHFDIDYIGREDDVWQEFYKRANELYDVDLFDSISAPFAKGIDPESGFIKVYRIQFLN